MIAIIGRIQNVVVHSCELWRYLPYFDAIHGIAGMHKDSQATGGALRCNSAIVLPVKARIGCFLQRLESDVRWFQFVQMAT